MPSSEKRASCSTVTGMLCAATFLLVCNYWWEPKQEKVESAVNTQGSLDRESDGIKSKEQISRNNLRKVVIFSYMKGGSSIFGKLFDTYLKGFLWYEPLYSFINHVYGTPTGRIPLKYINWANGTRRVTECEEISQLKEFFSAMLQCDLQSLPLETTTQSYFLQQSSALRAYCICAHRTGGFSAAQKCFKPMWHTCGDTAEKSVKQGCPTLSRAAESIIEGSNLVSATDQMRNFLISKGVAFETDLPKRARLFAEREQCLWKVRKALQSCWRIAEERCYHSTLRVLELNRMKMEDMEYIIQAFPEAHYFYYTRDPRGISLSRSDKKLIYVDNDSRAITESRHLCPRMLRDVVEFRKLHHKYPGLIHLVRYEDFVTNPISKSVEIYGHLGDIPPPQWARLVEKQMHAEEKKKYYVVDANKTATRWMHMIPAADLREMDDICGEVLDALSYPRYSSISSLK